MTEILDKSKCTYQLYLPTACNFLYLFFYTNFKEIVDKQTPKCGTDSGSDHSVEGTSNSGRKLKHYDCL